MLNGILVCAQGNIPFDKDHIQDPVALGAALGAMRQADKHSENGGKEYALALPLYEQALQVNPNNAELQVKVGLCHLNGKRRQLSLPHFEQAAALAPELPRVHFLLGMAYQLNARWDEAISSFEAHKASQKGIPDLNVLYNMGDKHIKECLNGKALMAQTGTAEVAPMGPEINSDEADHGVLLTADGSTLLFTSRRANTTGGKLNKATNEYFEDIYVSSRTGGGWSNAVPLPPPVNSKVNDASVGLFNDGRTMILYRDVKGAGDLYETRRIGDSWTEPTPLGQHINSRFHESSAWFSFDRQWLYFVSDRPEEGLGGQDIYRSRWDPISKDWGRAENLGPDVNTAWDEDGVFIHPDGKTLYFSSKGHNSMGGFDVFRTTLENGRWSKPENMGWPINSPDDDLFFVMTANGQKGYFSSFRADGMGEDDIYEVTFHAEAQDLETASMAATAVPEPSVHSGTVLIKGSVRTPGSNGLAANIDLMQIEDASLTASFQSDAETGEFIVAVPGGTEYAMHVRADGYLFHSENIHVPLGGSGLELTMEISLQPIRSGHQEVLRNVFFDVDKSDLGPGSKAELERLEQLLKENPSIRLEVSGHTDDDGSARHNLELSQARAQAVVDHLIAAGIDSHRLEAKGYGSAEPIAANDTAENKARNRRTAIRILAQ
ncbi:MAG: OmpA family protein [Flavobacteriales bacterium]|nr:OmpA family protein [Flavobacteriales bacterium]